MDHRYIDNLSILFGHLVSESHSYVWGIYHLLTQTITFTPKAKSARQLLPNSPCSIGHLHVIYTLLVKCTVFSPPHPNFLVVN